MKRTATKPKRAPAKAAPTTEPWLRYHPAFGMMAHDLDLGIAILMLHDATGGFEILGPVATINEGMEVARDDFKRRLDALDHGGDPVCPEVYRVWARDYEGEYTIAYEVRESDAVL